MKLTTRFPKNLHEFMRFGAVGGANALVGFFLFRIIWGATDWHYLVVNFLVLCVWLGPGFLGQAAFVFKRLPTLRGFLKYSAITFAMLPIFTGTLFLIAGVGGVRADFAFLLNIFLAASLTFIIQKAWVFGYKF